MSNIDNNQNDSNTQNNNQKKENKQNIDGQQSQNTNKKKSKKKPIQKAQNEIPSTEKINEKNKEILEGNGLNAGENKNSQSKENMKAIIKEQNELLTKEREYLKIVENLKIKLKNLEKSNQTQIDRITTENNEKENRIHILTSTNEKMKQSYGALTQRMDQLKKNLNKMSAESSRDFKKKEPKTEIEQKLADKEKEIKEKQKLINILSKENKEMKKSIDRFYELDVNKNAAKELTEKEQLKKKLELQIKDYEEVLKFHDSECVSTIQKLQQELNNIQTQLNQQNSEFHNTNKDYILLQCKFSLHNKENEQEYIKLRDKKNFLDMNKHNDFLNYNNYQSINMGIMEMYLKKKEFSRDLEKGIKKSFERVKSLPKIDVNNEKKVISSLFSPEELLELQELFMEEYNDESKLEAFMNKINELEKGNDTEKSSFDDLNNDCNNLENEIKEHEELIKIQQFKIKEKNYDISELNKKYKNLLKRNILLKKEENKLKDLLKEKNEKYLIKIKKDKQKQEIDKMIKDINNINYNEEEPSVIFKTSPNNKISNRKIIKKNLNKEEEDNINIEQNKQINDIENKSDEPINDNNGEEEGYNQEEGEEGAYEGNEEYGEGEEGGEEEGGDEGEEGGE